MTSATIRDVARLAEVSVATVSRTLNGFDSVAGATRDRVIRVADELDYVPHSSARALSTRRTDTVGVLLPDLHGEFFSELIRGIDLAARARGLHLLLSSSHGDLAEASAALRAMRSRVDSVIIMIPHAGDELLIATGSGGVPTVVIGNSGHVPSQHAFLIDNFAGAEVITRHLIELGRLNIAFVAGPADNLEAGERLRGYRSAMAEAQLAERVTKGDFGEVSGRTAVEQLLATDAPLDAIFCANDMMAIGALDGLQLAGVAVPGAVALAGFDDIPIARYVQPPLTTAAVPIAEIGRQALECCANAVAGARSPVNRTFTPQLIIRDSSASVAVTTTNEYV